MNRVETVSRDKIKREIEIVIEIEIEIEIVIEKVLEIRAIAFYF